MPTALYPIDPLELYGMPLETSTSYEIYGIDPAYQEISPSQNSPFPLLIFSPGFGLSAESYYQFGARLASYGFVVVVLANYGDGAIGEPWIEDEGTLFAWTAIDRTLDIQFLITQMLETNDDPANLLYQLIQPDQIAVSGHSWGGYASYALTGGDDLVCDNEPNYPGETCFPIEPDPRIKAIVTLDGSSWALHFNELSRVQIPHMTIGQEWDMLTSQAPEINSWHARTHAAVEGHPNYRVDIADAPHMAFTNVCNILHRNFDLGRVDEAFFNDVYPIACYGSPENITEAQNLTTMYMIAFLKTNLAGDHSYQYILTPGYALTEEPQVEFFVTEKRNGVKVTEEWPDYFFYFMHQPADGHAKALKDPPRPAMQPDFMIPIR